MRLLAPNVGEALDRLSILDLKLAAATSRGVPTADFELERAKLNGYLLPKLDTFQSNANGSWEKFQQARDELSLINSRLWNLEDEIRALRPSSDMLKIAEVALAIAALNDSRSLVMGDINKLFGVAAEEKLYSAPTAPLLEGTDTPTPAAANGKFRPFPSTRERPHPGEVLMLAERYEEALPFLEQQYAEDENGPRAAETLSNLGICYRISGRLKDSNNAYARALMKLPDNGVIWGNAALTMTDMGEHDAALLAATNAYRLDPSNKDVAFIYACILLREGRWAEALPLYEKVRPKYSLHEHVIPPSGENMKEWRGEEFPIGSRFLVVGEWGFGDAFMMLRYLGILKDRGAHVTYVAWKRQRSIFEGHPWIDQVHAYVKPGGDEAPVQLHSTDYDYFVCIMDLPAWFHSMPSSVPHPEAYLPYRGNLGSLRLAPTLKRRIGICWQAEESAYSHRFRSYRDTEIDALRSVDANWYSLQVGHALPWMEPHNPGAWLDTQALISQLDLVITVDTAIAHLAGAMGKPTWLLLPAGSAWQWLRDRSTSPWYASMRLFRSDAPDDFLALPEQAAKELR